MPRLGELATTTQKPQCDPFWTLMNGGMCSDTLGNFLRSDGTVVSFEELVASNKPSADGPAKFVLIGSIVLFGIVLIKGFRS